jgi:hypothetical protein
LISVLVLCHSCMVSHGVTCDGTTTLLSSSGRLPGFHCCKEQRNLCALSCNNHSHFLDIKLLVPRMYAFFNFNKYDDIYLPRSYINFYSTHQWWVTITFLLLHHWFKI